MKGTKYLLIVTIILFVVVFAITRIGLNDDDADISTDTSVSENPLETAVTFSEDTGADVDNKWAMFIVNNQNPLPDDYDNMIETTMVFEDYREYYMDSRMADYMTRMIEDAKKDRIDLLVVSAYRTNEYQKNNFEQSVKERMDNGMDYNDAYVDASASVAFPGKSEHNAGLAADIMCASNTSMDDDSFETTDEFAWLSEHAADYGFILRYPKGKSDYTGIIYEPWHYRFVGKYYANEINKLGMCLEEYYEYRGWLGADGKALFMTGPVEVTDNSPQGEIFVDAETIAPETKAPVTTTPEQSVSIIV